MTEGRVGDWNIAGHRRHPFHFCAGRDVVKEGSGRLVFTARLALHYPKGSTTHKRIMPLEPFVNGQHGDRPLQPTRGGRANYAMICDRRHCDRATSIGEGLHQRLTRLGGLDAHQTLIKPTLHIGQMARKKATIKHQLRVQPLIAIGACGD